jgi:hypothetical protein
MSIRPQTKKSLREAMAESETGMAFYARLAGKPVTESKIKPKREIVNRSQSEDLESAVMSEVRDVLLAHPLVLFAVRQNAGTAFRRDEKGREIPVAFYKFLSKDMPMRISDYWGMLKDGRLFAFECKRRNWEKPADQRENEQKNFLDAVKSGGGVACFVTCSKRVIESLGG